MIKAAMRSCNLILGRHAEMTSIDTQSRKYLTFRKSDKKFSFFDFTTTFPAMTFRIFRLLSSGLDKNPALCHYPAKARSKNKPAQISNKSMVNIKPSLLIKFSDPAV